MKTSDTVGEARAYARAARKPAPGPREQLGHELKRWRTLLFGIVASLLEVLAVCATPSITDIVAERLLRALVGVTTSGGGLSSLLADLRRAIRLTALSAPITSIRRLALRGLAGQEVPLLVPSDSISDASSGVVVTGSIPAGRPDPRSSPYEVAGEMPIPLSPGTPPARRTLAA